MPKKSKAIRMIVKTTDLCNLNCKYCYAPRELSRKGKMTDETLQNLTKETFEHFDTIGFNWLGGEPLLAGLDFYKKAIDIQNDHKMNHKVSNILQTNGTLIDDDFLDFFQKENFRVGLSIDGGREFHNLTRPYHNGKGSYDDVITSLDEMKKRDILSVVKFTLNKTNLNNCMEIYDFCKSYDVPLAINPLLSKGRALTHPELSITPDMYADVMIKLFDVWFSDKKFHKLFPFDNITEDLVLEYRRGNNYQNCRSSCMGDIIYSDIDGDLYPCVEFDGDTKFILGNINRDCLWDIMNSDIKQYAHYRGTMVEECKPCEYTKICNGGCMHNAYLSEGDVKGKDPYCSARKMLYDHISDAIRKEILKSSAI